MTTPATRSDAHHADWAELLADLVQELTSRDAEIEFKNLEVQIPVSSSADTPHAPWRLNGVVRFHTRPERR